MVSEPTPSADTGNGPSSEALIFVSDASAEAERITSGLRVRGYLTVDVPLGLLVGRVAVQPPALILCDVDAPQALETIERMRALPSTSNIDVLFIGEAGRTLDEQAERVGVQGSGIFVRPVDVGALTRRIETLLGPPKTTGARLSSPPQASRVPVLVAATRKPYRYDARGKASRPSFESIPPPPLPSEPPHSNSQWPSSPTASGETRPGLSARTSLDPYAGFDTRAGGEGRAGHDLLENADPYAISPDLAQLLGRAERRVLESKHFAAHGERLSPEAELEAILPEDLLSALDEPLDELDGDDDDPGTPGTHGESSFGARSRSSHDSQGGGTSPGGAAPAPAARESTTSGGDRVDEIAQDKPAPPAEPVRDMAPATPQASRHQRTSPPSLTHTGVDTGFGSIPPAPALPSEALPANAASPPSSERDSSPAQRHRRSTRPPRPRPPRELGEDSAAELEPGPPPRPAITGPHAQGSTYGTGPASSSRNGARAERTAPPLDRNERGASPPERAERVEIEIPNTLRGGDALRVLARAVRARYSGAIAFEDNAGIRRLVLRDGDFVIAAAGIEPESLLNFLVQRGDLSA
ncbi:MAG TPA: hypothetical protein VFQ35_14610, partial [Polyangiaceae bacterium]|nr:hypothetical protein [Polyangiaceae bacterium]